MTFETSTRLKLKLKLGQQFKYLAITIDLFLYSYLPASCKIAGLNMTSTLLIAKFEFYDDDVMDDSDGDSVVTNAQPSCGRLPFPQVSSKAY